MFQIHRGLRCLVGLLLVGLWMLSAPRPAPAQHLATSNEVTPAQVFNPRINYEWVSDSAGVFSGEVRAWINQKLTQLERDTSVEVALVTVDAVSSPTPKDFATELFAHWKIGKRSSDNGLLILMVMQSHRVEIETGYGLEGVLSDGWLKQMQGSEMVPKFKEGDFESGLEAGVDAIITRLTEQEDALALDAGDGSIELIDLTWLC